MPRSEPGHVEIRLRPVAPSDVALLFAMQSDAESNAMAGTKPRSWEVFTALWERVLGDASARARVIEEVGPGGVEVVGSISSFEADGHVCVGYGIARGHWGRGIASRALALFLAEETRRPLHATTAKENVASRRVLERCGFRLVGYGVGEETERYVAGEIAEFVLE